MKPASTLTRSVGADVARLEGMAKVTGQARYAAEFLAGEVAYGWPVTATVGKGTVAGIDTDAVRAWPGVLDVLTHDTAPRLREAGDAELLLLQSPRVAYRGQIVALVVAGTLEQARAAAEAAPVSYDEQPPDVELSTTHPGLYKPEKVNPSFETDTATGGDVDAALAGADVLVDETYSTPAEHNNPMEPHATTAAWDGDRLTVYDSNQGASSVKRSLVALFGLQPDAVRVVSEHVGGGFGSKGSARPPVVLAAMAARAVGQPVRVVLSRQMMFALVGYRTPTIQRVRLGATADGTLVGVDHEAFEQTSTVLEFAEQTTVATRSMYAAPAIRTRHRLVALDVPTPRWMRAPGECPGMYALESAMDELAVRLELDPIQLRLRNEPDVDPETGHAFSSRNLVACLQEGARRFGWADRDPRPAQRRLGRWLSGTGVASSTYPARSAPSTATARVDADGRYTVRIAAVDIGTGARTALTQVAADAFDVPLDRVEVQIGDSDFGEAMIAGGSMGTASWSWAIAKAARSLRDELDGHGGSVPAGGCEVTVNTGEDIKAQAELTRQAFGAQFVEVRVDQDTGEVRVPRMLGVFAAGRIVNARTARSQFLGGMTMGLSMALHEESLMDPQFGDYVNHDLAEYHVAANADVGAIDVHWIDEQDDQLNPVGVKGIGEIGIVGTAAAVANAVYHATGVRVRDLPIRLDRLLSPQS